MTPSKDLIFDIYEKVNGRSDSDWVEIAQEHGLDISTETLRKAGVGIRMAGEAGVLDFEGVVPDTYEKLYSAKKQFFDQRRMYNSELAKEARAEHLAERLADAANRLAKEYPIVMQRLPQYDTRTEAVLILSDWHVGLKTENIWNTFNLDICEERLNQLCEEANYQMKVHRPERLHVVLLGDFVEGAIHTSCRVASEEYVCDQIMLAAEMIAQVVDQLRCYSNETLIYSTYGNHARTVAELKDSAHADNIEKLIPFWLKQRFGGIEGVAVVDSQIFEFVEMEVCGKYILGTHGDLEKKDSLLTLSTVFRRKHGRDIDYFLTGHLHSAASEDVVGMKSIRVSSLCGTDEYAKNKRLFSAPGQTMLFFRENVNSYTRIDIEFER